MTKAELYVIDHLYKGFERKEMSVWTKEVWLDFYLFCLFSILNGIHEKKQVAEKYTKKKIKIIISIPQR